MAKGQPEKKPKRLFIGLLCGTFLGLLLVVVNFTLALTHSLERSAILWLTEVTSSYGSMMHQGLLDRRSSMDMLTSMSQYRFTVLGEMGTLLVVDREGKQLYASCGGNQAVPDNNIFDYFSDSQLPQSNSLQLIRDHMSVSTSDGLVLSRDGQKMFVGYAPTGHREQYIFCLVPYDIISQQMHDILRSAFYVDLLMLLFFLLMMGYVGYTGRAQMRITTEQQKQMRASEARYKLIAQKSKDIIFEYDLPGGYMVHSENADVLTSPALRTGSIAHNLVEKGRIHPEDAGIFHAAIRQVLSDQLYAEVTLRARMVGTDYLWYQLTMACVPDNKNRPWRVVGRARDVDRQKREEELLMERASKDPLTKLLNKMATRKAIDALLEDAPTQVHAYLIIDIDYFKQVNDNYGHAMGDAVLAQAGERLTKLFRSSDILGRIGGDEMVVFCRDIKTQELAEKRALQICELFRTLGQELEGGPIPLSCSVGVAMAPRDGESFNQLYVNADLALYTSKGRGRNQHTVYDTALRKAADAHTQAAVAALL